MTRAQAEYAAKEAGFADEEVRSHRVELWTLYALGFTAGAQASMERAGELCAALVAVGQQRNDERHIR